jgi:hypothetical protein
MTLAFDRQLTVKCISNSHLREVDGSKHTSCENIHFNKIRMLKAGTNKVGGTARQVGWVNQVGWVRQVGQQGRQTVTIPVPFLSANILATATNRTNIHNKIKMLKAGTNKAGRTARQVGWVRQVGQQGRQAVTILWR